MDSGMCGVGDRALRKANHIAWYHDKGHALCICQNTQNVLIVQIHRKFRAKILMNLSKSRINIVSSAAINIPTANNVGNNQILGWRMGKGCVGSILCSQLFYQPKSA